MADIEQQTQQIVREVTSICKAIAKRTRIHDDNLRIKIIRFLLFFLVFNAMTNISIPLFLAFFLVINW